MAATTLAEALGTGPIILDGGLSTQLERAGHDVSGQGWTAALLRTDPEAIRRAHTAFFTAGAQVAITSSYQAHALSWPGLPDAEVAALLRRSVHLARSAQLDVDRPDTWVAASVGPFGAVLGGGVEYTGDYPAAFDSVAALRAWHRPRLEILAEAGPDVLACETVPNLTEVEALLLELQRLGLPAWVSLTTVTDDTGRVLTRRGEDAAEAFTMIASADTVIAAGINCTDPHGVDAAVDLAATHSAKPVVVYPNSGELWDAAARRWHPADAASEPRGQDVSTELPWGVDRPQGWARRGARLIGGCCRIDADQIAALAQALR